ncbi:uncharacterized protein DDB_G0287625-like [Penaeus indicus]|uniref:uncharacterized protein DDB_G0287625-like n=1 Tax=Penaeus indicus TaxID=29960 RepID=UPI00300CE1AA
METFLGEFEERVKRILERLRKMQSEIGYIVSTVGRPKSGPYHNQGHWTDANQGRSRNGMQDFYGGHCHQRQAKMSLTVATRISSPTATKQGSNSFCSNDNENNNYSSNIISYNSDLNSSNGSISSTNNSKFNSITTNSKFNSLNINSKFNSSNNNSNSKSNSKISSTNSNNSNCSSGGTSARPRLEEPGYKSHRPSPLNLTRSCDGCTATLEAKRLTNHKN